MVTGLEPLWAWVFRLILLFIGATNVWLALPFFIFLISTTIFQVRNQMIDRVNESTILFLGVSISAYLILPTDWIGELRFATPVFLFLYLLFYQQLQKLNQLASKNSSNKRGIQKSTVILIAFLGFISLAFFNRGNIFIKSPTTPFEDVGKKFGEKSNSYANCLQLEKASILLPDIGGTLYYSRLTVYDLAGLTDRVIAKTRGRDPEEFYNYLFISIKPTFIHTHEYFTFVSNFEEDHRFRRDYIPIAEYIDPWIVQQYQIEMYSGDFVRKDVLRKGDLDCLHEIYLDYLHQ